MTNVPNGVKFSGKLRDGPQKQLHFSESPHFLTPLLSGKNFSEHSPAWKGLKTSGNSRCDFTELILNAELAVKRRHKWRVKQYLMLINHSERFSSVVTMIFHKTLFSLFFFTLLTSNVFSSSCSSSNFLKFWCELVFTWKNRLWLIRKTLGLRPYWGKTMH